jgi:hypothetical protein
MLQRYDTESIALEGDGMERGGWREEVEGYMPNRQNHIVMNHTGGLRAQAIKL